ncbi:13249_t:CDS:2, partial [Funneliformis geosporum]
RLLTAHSEALLYMMNDSGIMSITIKHRLALVSPLQLETLDISFDLNDIRPNLILGGTTSISSFIQHKYKGIAKDL